MLERMTLSATQAVPPQVALPVQVAHELAAQYGPNWAAHVFPELNPEAILLCPTGGAGTSELFAGEKVFLPTLSSTGKLMTASYLWVEAEKLAIIECAQFETEPLTSENWLTNDSYGIGVLIADAQTRGAQTCWLAMADCQIADGGLGMITALGASAIDAKGLPVSPGAIRAPQIADLDFAQLNMAAAGMKFVLLTDPDVDLLLPELTELLEPLLSLVSPRPKVALAAGLVAVSTALYGDAAHVELLSGPRLVADVLRQLYGEQLQVYLAAAELPGQDS